MWTLLSGFFSEFFVGFFRPELIETLVRARLLFCVPLQKVFSNLFKTFFSEPTNNRLNFFVSAYPVWPDWAKFRHLGKHRCYDLYKIFSPKKLAKKLAFFAHTSASFCKNWHWFLRKVPFFRLKIGKNCRKFWSLNRSLVPNFCELNYGTFCQIFNH
jgi:hypothetical protein